MKLWIYCDNCDATRPLMGDDLTLLKAGDWRDLCCDVCKFIVATISAGDDQGNLPPHCTDVDERDQ